MNDIDKIGRLRTSFRQLKNNTKRNQRRTSSFEDLRTFKQNLTFQNSNKNSKNVDLSPSVDGFFWVSDQMTYYKPSDIIDLNISRIEEPLETFNKIQEKSSNDSLISYEKVNSEIIPENDFDEIKSLKSSLSNTISKNLIENNTFNEILKNERKNIENLDKNSIKTDQQNTSQNNKIKEFNTEKRKRPNTLIKNQIDPENLTNFHLNKSNESVNEVDSLEVNIKETCNNPETITSKNSNSPMIIDSEKATIVSLQKETINSPTNILHNMKSITNTEISIPQKSLQETILGSEKNLTSNAINPISANTINLEKSIILSSLKEEEINLKNYGFNEAAFYFQSESENQPEKIQSVLSPTDSSWSGDDKEFNKDLLTKETKPELNELFKIQNNLKNVIRFNDLIKSSSFAEFHQKQHKLSSASFNSSPTYKNTFLSTFQTSNQYKKPSSTTSLLLLGTQQKLEDSLRGFLKAKAEKKVEKKKILSESKKKKKERKICFEECDLKRIYYEKVKLKKIFLRNSNCNLIFSFYLRIFMWLVK